MKIVIPARKGSKGLPHKNRKLLDYTLDGIPEEYMKETYVSTDDEDIKKRVQNRCNVHHRSQETSRDTSSILSLMLEARMDLNFLETEVVVMLYLTYPGRTFNEVQKIYNIFLEKRLKSLLCAKSVKTNPFLCMYELDAGKGKQIVEHNLYRRQDYPKCFEISHYVSIFECSELNNLNNNLYNEETYYHKICDVIDVDEEKDFGRFLLDGED